jgi:hypothetical protein
VLDELGVEAGFDVDSEAAGFDSAGGLDSVEGLLSPLASEAGLSVELALPFGA